MTFLFLAALHSCVEEPDIHVGTTYLREQRIKWPHVNALAGTVKQDSIQVRGVYWPHLYAVRTHPALLRINASDQLEFTLLADSLDVPYGDIVRLSGVAIDSVVPLGYTYEKKVTMLRADHIRIEQSTHGLPAKAQKDYQTCRSQLQERARQPGSKLAWPQQPDWQLVLDEKRSKVIAFFGAADLMYAVDVNLVYDLPSQELKEVYAHEWFKGE
ncbi:hypothetical protein JW998_15335 [candidate division KSB1 bacterium]|nr:hypothetical protein [candidate division KSB1 bacterium]